MASSAASTLNAPLRTTVVGSYPQPDWLVDRTLLGSRLPPRIRAREIWRIADPWLAQAQDDATLIAIRDMERAGIDLISDGEIRRESYSNRFATALDGIDVDNPGTALDRTGHANPVPRIVGPIRRREPVMLRDVEFLRRNTDLPIRFTVPGPFTMAQQAQNDYYPDVAAAALGFAAAVNEELRDLKRAGADVVQIDEPYLQARSAEAQAYALPAIARALDGIDGLTALHTCFGYAHVVHSRPAGYPFLAELDGTPAQQIVIESMQQKVDLAMLASLPHKRVVLGVIDLDDNAAVETPAAVAAQIRAALTHITPERLMLAPDCGMKYLPRATAFAKLCALVEGTKIVRRELGLPD
ncbi:MAG: cobalamin-independent methionine synthase II family protein [Candidatus Lustribacter sp.]|jgi:5-methyltetrahydropteroyltriglutamate--homocysteine methyltransferase